MHRSTMGSTRAPLGLLSPLAGAALFVLVAQVVRALFPHVLVLGEDVGYVVAGLLAIATFASPALALPLASRLSPGRAIRLAALAIVAARLSLQLVHPFPAWVAFAATAVALMGAAFVMEGVRTGRADDRMLLPAVVFGLAIDTAIRSVAWTWDPVWQDSTVALASTAVLATVAVAAAWFVSTRRAEAAAVFPTTGGGIVAALGPYLVLQLLFLQNPGYVGSQSGIGLSGCVLVVLAADALGLIAASLVVTRSPGILPTVVVTAMAAGLGWLATSVEGAGAIWLVVGLQMAVTVLLALALTPRDPEGWASPRTVIGVSVATLSFVVLAFLWMVDIDRSLPFSRDVVPAAAAAAIGVAGLTRVLGTRRLADRSVPATSRAIGAATIALAVGAAGFLRLTEPVLRVEPIAGPAVRVVSYNIRGAVDADGMHRLGDVARAIASSDPDVVILQEVARGWPLFGGGDVLAYLQRSLEMPYRYEPAADRQFGNAILTRLPLETLDASILPETRGAQRRSYLAVRVEVGPRELVVVDTHLEPDSLDQIDAVLEAWGGRAPALIAGDLNLDPGDESTVARFRDAGLVDAEAVTGDECRTTSSEPTSSCDRPDWIWMTPDLEVRTFRIGTADASDHLPIHLTIELPA